MEQTKIELNVIQGDFKTEVDAQTIASAIYVEESRQLHTVSKITLSGKYSRVYTIVDFFFGATKDKVLIDDDLLIVCLFSTLVIIDLKEDKLKQVIDFNCWQLFKLFKFKSGYFIHGEGENRFLDKDFNVVWKESCCDIFFNSKVEKDLEIFDDYIVAWDWYGHKHYYNESGEFKTEYYPEYRMSD